MLLSNDGLLPLDRERTRRVAVLGPLADTLHVDWYSGTLPYAVTPRAGLADLLGAGSVTCHEGVDRIALRTADGRPCTVTVTRSCCRPTRPTSSDRCAFTSASDRFSVMVTSMTSGCRTHQPAHAGFLQTTVSEGVYAVWNFSVRTSSSLPGLRK